MTKMLIVLTSHAKLGDTGRSTGFHWEELTTPYWIFRDAGIEVDIASIAGGLPPYDPTSLDKDAAKNPESVSRFRQDKAAMAALKATRPVANVTSEIYDGIFLPGGHGTMWDISGDASLARLIGGMAASGKVLGAVCHGPAGLLGATRIDGRPLVEGKRINSFTDAEERAAKLADVVPFLLESRLREQGAKFEGGSDFGAYAVRDGLLVTGQNPASATLVAQHMIEALAERDRQRAA